MTHNASDAAQVRKKDRESKTFRSNIQMSLTQILNDDLSILFIAHLLEEHGIHTILPASESVSVMAYNTARQNTATSLFNEIMGLNDPRLTARIERVLIENRKQKQTPDRETETDG